MQASASYVTGSHNIKVGFQRTWGTFTHTRRRATPISRSSTAATRPASVHRARHGRHPQHAADDYGERLNYDLGIYAQDSWTMKRLTINAGMRWEALNAQVLEPASRRPAASSRRALRRDREPAELEGLAPRFSAGLRPVRQRQDRAQVLAEPLQPGAHDGHRRQLQPAAVGDVDRLAVDRRQRRRHRPGRARLRRYPTRRAARSTSRSCRRTSASPRSTATATIPRTWNLEQGVELQHELMPRLSVTGAGSTATFHNLTTHVSTRLDVRATTTPITRSSTR